MLQAPRRPKRRRAGTKAASRAPCPLRPPPRASRELRLSPERNGAPRLEADGAPSRATAARSVRPALQGAVTSATASEERCGFPQPRSIFRGHGFPKRPPGTVLWPLNLSLGRAGGGVLRGQPSSLGRAADSPEKRPFHSFLGGNSGGSCCRREEPCAQPWLCPLTQPTRAWRADGSDQTRTHCCPAAPRLGLVPVLAKRGKKLRGSSTHLEGPTDCSTLSDEEYEALPLLSAVHGRGWGGWLLELHRDL